MKSLIVIAVCLLGAVLPLPHKKYGNPDEWGPYFQGDIKGPVHMSRNGLIDPQYHWPNATVPFIYSATFNENNKAVVQQAMDSYSTLTNGCVKFVARTSESNYVEFIDSESGCYSYVGMIGGRQEINYPQWCIDQYGSVQHEMYHALGFYHEQSRTDRDDYVTIQWVNIEVGTEHNFVKYSADVISPYGQSYDYGSVMHYSGYAFSRNGELTIVTTDPTAQDVIGQRVGLSQVDIAKLMAMYECPS